MDHGELLSCSSCYRNMWVNKNMLYCLLLSLSLLFKQTASQSISASDSTIESPAKPIKAFTGVRASKFRHLHGTPMHKSNNIENVRNLSISLPGDSDGFQVNRDFVAYPLSGPGGQIAVVSVSFDRW